MLQQFGVSIAVLVLECSFCKGVGQRLRRLVHAGRVSTLSQIQRPTHTQTDTHARCTATEECGVNGGQEWCTPLLGLVDKRRQVMWGPHAGTVGLGWKQGTSIDAVKHPLRLDVLSTWDHVANPRTIDHLSANVSHQHKG